MDGEYKTSSSKLEKLPRIEAQCCVNLTPPKAGTGIRRSVSLVSFIRRAYPSVLWRFAFTSTWRLWNIYDTFDLRPLHDRSSWFKSQRETRQKSERSRPLECLQTVQTEIYGASFLRDIDSVLCCLGDIFDNDIRFVNDLNQLLTNPSHCNLL